MLQGVDIHGAQGLQHAFDDLGQGMIIIIILLLILILIPILILILILVVIINPSTHRCSLISHSILQEI